MLALALHYLNGWAMAAADGARKEQAEWPPHPDRVFMALAAAHFETDDGDQAAERAALEWLEALPPPAIAASGHTPRRLVIHYVPVNDARRATHKRVAELVAAAAPPLAGLKDAGLALLPELRGRQARAFPVAVPHEPLVHLIWPDAEPTPEQHRALSALCQKLTHVGHSASLVAAWLDEQPPPATLLPDAMSSAIGGQRLRVPGPGRLARLAARCDRGEAVRWADQQARIDALKARLKATKGAEKKGLKATLDGAEAAMAHDFPKGAPVPTLDPKLFRPDPAAWQGYAEPPPALPAGARMGLFDPTLVVLSLSGHRLGLLSTARLVGALRNALLKGCAEQPPPEWLSGHGADGRPSADPHVALLPLPFVGDAHADGRVMGLALALPRGLDQQAVARCLGPVLFAADGAPKPLHLFDGEWFDCEATLQTLQPPPQKALRNDVWTGPARFWASVTPVVFDRHFDGPDRWERAADSLKIACERIGLPRPDEVLLEPVSRIRGVPKASDFTPLTRKRDGGRMHQTHVTLIFAEPVLGPVLIGAGRFRGYGLCRPWSQGGRDD